jgi:hypothetical protein
VADLFVKVQAYYDAQFDTYFLYFDADAETNGNQNTLTVDTWDTVVFDFVYYNNADLVISGMSWADDSSNIVVADEAGAEPPVSRSVSDSAAGAYTLTLTATGFPSPAYLYLTVAEVTNPDPNPTVTIASRTNVDIASRQYSLPTTPTNFNVPCSVSISNGEYIINGVLPYTNASGTLEPGDNITVRHVSSEFGLTSATSTVTFNGTVDATFTSVTRDSNYGLAVFNDEGILVVDTSTRLPRFVVYGETAFVSGQGGTVTVLVPGMENNDSWLVFCRAGNPTTTIFELVKGTGEFTITHWTDDSLYSAKFYYWVFKS